MIEASIWDTFPEHIKEVIRKADRQIIAADALADALETVEWDEDAYCMWCKRTQEAGHGSDCQRQKALREYQEVSNG